MNVESGTGGAPEFNRVSEGGTDSSEEIEQRTAQSDSSGGVFEDRLSEIEPKLLAFGRALGGDPDDISSLPFTEEAGTDGMPEPLYVRHDEELLNQITTWLLQRQHIGLISPYGTGKSALKEIARQSLGERDDFVVATLPNANETTPRGLFECVLRAGYDAGYEIDTERYWQVSDGVPWATDEVRDAVGRLAEVMDADDTTLLLVVDEIEDLPTELLGPLQTIADVGVRLFLTGTPEGQDRLREFRETLDSRMRYYEGIDRFSVDDIEEYIARSLAYFRGESYDDQEQSLFTSDAIIDIYKRTSGKPRAVRLECQDMFAHAAFVYDRANVAIDRINISSALRNRSFAMSD